jgi:NAD(P)-dependent dehydrogenase (short-subunit alcohol dehydrogenase family)
VSDGPLAGRVAVVTGGGSGIGRATVERFVADGAAVVLADVSAAAEAVAREIDPGGERVAYARTDVTVAADVDAAFALARSRFGRVDIAVNNAGIVAGGALHLDGADEAFTRMWQICVAGVWYSCRAAVAIMREQGGGVILNTASSAALWPTPAAPAYGLTKAAVLHLTRSLASAYSRDGIRVNAVLPGPTRTNIFTAAGAADMSAVEASYVERVPIARMIDPAEIAGAYAYLASDQASAITGAALQVDGAFVPPQSL